VNPEKALKAGLIHELAEDATDLITKAKAWIKANPKSSQPWDVRLQITGRRTEPPSGCTKISNCAVHSSPKNQRLLPSP